MAKDDYISASELAKLGYCERKVAFDAAHGPRTTSSQRRAQDHGLRAHEAFYEEGRRIVLASERKGRCFVATLALGECEQTRALRVFRDLYLRRLTTGRWFIHTYYRYSPALCAWLETRPKTLQVVRWLVQASARLAVAAVAVRIDEVDHER